MKRNCLIMLLGIFFYMGMINAAVIHVPADQPSIQAGINAAEDGDTVMVAPGTYQGDGNRNIELFSKAITVQGSGSDTCLIDCENEENGFYCHHGELETTVIAGFSIMFGSSSGIKCYQSSPTIENCRVERCSGGIYCSYSDSTIRSCVLDTTRTGFHCYYATPLIEDCVMTNCNCSGVDIWYSKVNMNRCTVSNNSNDLGGAGISSWQSKLYMDNCLIENNDLFGTDILYGAGIFSCGISLEMNHCVIRNNTIHSDPPYFESGSGAGLFIQSDLSLANCLIRGNVAINGEKGGVYCASRDYVNIQNCTITDNQDKGLDTGGSYARIWNCNIWDESGFGPNTTVWYCNLDRFYEGDGNISQDPLFVSGPNGNYYLSQIAAGQSLQSPCVDAGYIDASECSIGDETMDQRTTRTDTITDVGLIDFGYHYSIDQIPPIPTPITATPTLVPATPTVPPLGVDLQISFEVFTPGDLFLLQAIIANPGPETYDNVPFVVVLEAYSQYFWYPAWSSNFTYLPMDLETGSFTSDILSFTWPNLDGSGSGINIYGTLLHRDFSEILGQWDMVSFSWSS
ncbi:right-handed parallel beta-helix repeat-containing protein [bacterium]|nr:right-handed parallel beta-helix repeat-containing protein [bacterium]